MLSQSELHDFLNEKASFYESRWFIDEDPVQIPHLFRKKEDIEIAGFLTATLAWGKRSMILKSCKILMEYMDYSPGDFVMNASAVEKDKLNKFVYRTFNGIDLAYFLKALQAVYRQHDGLHGLFSEGYAKGGVPQALVHFREVFMGFDAPERTGKHVANVMKNASAKRLNMFLRWMVRPGSPVDFGLWRNINPTDLLIPLDLHVARVARSLCLLERKQNDFKSVKELTKKLSDFRPHDPIFYDYGLFGLGVYEKF
jgi:uncharacterized protein (TIGR02757 family)